MQKCQLLNFFIILADTWYLIFWHFLLLFSSWDSFSLQSRRCWYLVIYAEEGSCWTLFYCIIFQIGHILCRVDFRNSFYRLLSFFQISGKTNPHFTKVISLGRLLWGKTHMFFTVVFVDKRVVTTSFDIKNRFPLLTPQRRTTFTMCGLDYWYKILI